MKQIIKTSLLMFAVLTLITGILYPAAVWVAANLIFPFQAGGSLVKNGAEIKGSVLIAQDFLKPGYFHPRPSAVAYDASNSGGSNIAASNPDFAKSVFERAAKEKKMNPLSPGLIPVDMLTASSSGLDPDITMEAAFWQVKRVAAARGLDENAVTLIIQKLKENPLLGFIGPERINVLKLNLYLDSLAAK